MGKADVVKKQSIANGNEDITRDILYGGSKKTEPQKEVEQENKDLAKRVIQYRSTRSAKGQGKTKNVAVRMDPKVHAALMEISLESRISVNSLIELAAVEYIDKYRNKR